MLRLILAVTLLPGVPADETTRRLKDNPSLEGAPVLASTYYPQSIPSDKGVRFAVPPGDHATAESSEDTVLEPDAEETFKLTTDKLAYILIGSCCGLSIVCLIVVALSLRCRDQCHRKNKKKVTKLPFWQPPPLYTMPPPPMHLPFQDSSYSSNNSCETCRCTCAMWTLGPRNLDHRFVRMNRGPRKLPFGAGSALHYETLGIRGSMPIKRTTVVPHYSSSSDSEVTTSSRRCTCIEPFANGDWDVSPDSLETSDENQFSWRNCSYLVDTLHRHHTGLRQQWPGTHLAKVQMPVAGRNYLENPRGVVFWSPNRERLI